MLQVAKWMVSHPHGAVLLDPGMRKTSITLAAFCALQKAWDAKLKAQGFNREQRRAMRLRGTVIAPRRVVHRVWPKEVEKWEDFAHLKVAICHGSPKIRERACKDDFDLIVMTHEGFKWYADAGWLTKHGCKVLVVDELSKFKRGSTARHKHIRKHLPAFDVRWGLTGSFTPKSLLDTWGQIYVVDLGRALGKWFSHFRTDLFSPTGYGGYTWMAKPDTERILLARLKETAISLNADDYITLPKLMYDDRVFDLPPDVRAQYEDMERELLALVEDERVSAANSAVAQAKCRQICSGGLYMGTDDAVLLHEEKLDILEELLDELQGAPLFAIYEWRWEAEAVQHRFGSKTRRIPVLGGGTSDKAADAMIDAWNAGDEPLIMVHPQSGGHGLNMQGSNCAHVLGLTLPWDGEAYDQVLRRVLRSGNTSKRMWLHRALAANSVEFDVVKSLETRLTKQFNFVSALRLRARGLRGGK